MITGELEALVQRGLRVVNQSDRDLGLLGSNKSNSETLLAVSDWDSSSLGRTDHLSGTDHTQRFDLGSIGRGRGAETAGRRRAIATD